MDGIEKIDIYDVGFAMYEDGRDPDERDQPDVLDYEYETDENEKITGRKLAKKVNSSGGVISPLATYKHITSKSNPRTGKPKGFTFHHMSGKHTGQWCADYFCDTSRQVSSNYCTGYNGDIACNVPEDRRAWTSSSRANDMDRITVEMSNDGGAPDWHVSEKTVQATINLAVDCCRRWGIKKIWYDGTKNAPVTWHCMFSDTDCPGPYLKRISNYICGQVNSRLGSELLGDLDGDGKVTAKDARLALRLAAGISKPSFYQLRVGDLDGDGKIGAGDARKILRKAAKLK